MGTLDVSVSPASISVIESSSVLINCAVSSTTQPTMEWWFTPTGAQQPLLVANQLGAQLPGYSIQVGIKRLSLLIEHAQFERSNGEYVCRAFVDGLMETASAHLNVLRKLYCHT